MPRPSGSANARVVPGVERIWTAVAIASRLKIE